MRNLGPLGKWLATPDRALLGGFLVFALAAWAFVEIADEVGEGEWLAADRRLLERRHLT